MFHRTNRIRYILESAYYAVKWRVAGWLHDLAAILDDEACREAFDLERWDDPDV